jgi:ubiquinone/menaquinone biosynthesis C-methylase UbiE
MSSFTPPQALPINGATLGEFLGTATFDIAKQHVGDLAPFAPDSLIHDNGCGAGAVTEAIMSTDPPPGIRIKATDVNAAAAAALRGSASAAAWPVDVSEMNSKTLDFPNDHFSHNFLNFVILQVLPDDVQCTREIYRTLKPGGIAVVTTFEDLPTMAVFKAVHKYLRGDTQLPAMLQLDGYGGEEARKAMLKAGFHEANLKIKRVSSRVRVRSPRRWCEIGWSLGGAAAGGWKSEDEKTWDDAVDKAMEIFTAGPWWQLEAGGEGGWVTLEASVIVAVK